MLKAGGKRVWLGGNILVSPLDLPFPCSQNGCRRLGNEQLPIGRNRFVGHFTAGCRVDQFVPRPSECLSRHGGICQSEGAGFRHQQPNDVVFLPPEKTFDAYADEAPGEVIRFAKKNSPEAKLVAATKMKLLGEHNVRNAMTAVAVASHLGIKKASIVKVLRSFAGLPDRLEVIAKKRGVTFVNDSTSTMPDATMAAIRALESSVKRDAVACFWRFRQGIDV